MNVNTNKMNTDNIIIRRIRGITRIRMRRRIRRIIIRRRIRIRRR